MGFFKDLSGFVRNVAGDERIPARDKALLAALIALLVSPVDLIPDWIPVFGQLDDLVILALVLDYLFRVLDPELLLSHYPWGMQSFARVRRFSRFLSWLAPDFIKKRLWAYAGSPYR